MFEPVPQPLSNFSSLRSGVFLVKRPSKYLVVDHYGVLVVGKLLQAFGYYPSGQVVIHLTDMGLQGEWAQTSGSWVMLGQVPTYLESDTASRFAVALTDQNYDLFQNNCEHFARFVTQGKKQSTQVNAAVILGVAGLAYWAANRS